MREKILNSIDSIWKFFSLAHNEAAVFPFKNWAQIPRSDKGVYIIFSPTEIIYVGKGKIRARQPMHLEKALGQFKHAKDTVGWNWLRENKEVAPDDWNLVVISNLGATERSAVEGSLIHILQPLANDEVFEDRSYNG